MMRLSESHQACLKWPNVSIIAVSTAKIGHFFDTIAIRNDTKVVWNDTNSK